MMVQKILIFNLKPYIFIDKHVRLSIKRVNTQRTLPTKMTTHLLLQGKPFESLSYKMSLLKVSLYY